MSKRSVLSAARQLLKHRTTEEKSDYLAVLGQQWGLDNAIVVAGGGHA